jgi:hypothetical protein
MQICYLWSLSASCRLPEAISQVIGISSPWRFSRVIVPLGRQQQLLRRPGRSGGVSWRVTGWEKLRNGLKPTSRSEVILAGDLRTPRPPAAPPSNDSEPTDPSPDGWGFRFWWMYRQPVRVGHRTPPGGPPGGDGVALAAGLHAEPREWIPTLRPSGCASVRGQSRSVAACRSTRIVRRSGCGVRMIVAARPRASLRATRAARVDLAAGLSTGPVLTRPIAGVGCKLALFHPSGLLPTHGARAESPGGTRDVPGPRAHDAEVTRETTRGDPRPGRRRAGSP